MSTIITIADMKTALGLSTGASADDASMQRSADYAENLVGAYIGMEVGLTDRVHDVYGESDPNMLSTPCFPVNSLSVFQMDGVAVPATSYWVDLKRGQITMKSRAYRWSMSSQEGSHFHIEYNTGWNGTTCPKDLKDAILNIALNMFKTYGSNIYNLSGGTGELKSMTMFDAMSMSFDVGDSESSSKGVEGIVNAWAFVLDSYSVKKYVMSMR